MAKFNIEVDSETKSIKILKDGQAITPESFAVSTYECTDITGRDYYCTCLSYSFEESEGVTNTYYLHFDGADIDDVNEGKDEYGMASSVKKIHQRTNASYKLSNLLQKRK